MDSILEQITDWLKEMLVSGIMQNLSGMFDSVNQRVGDITTQVGTTPAAFSPGIFSMIQNAEPFSEFVPSIYPELWKAISEYNQGLYESGQEGIHSLRNLEESCFTLSSYGVESDAFGVLSIPALELEMPIYLGASSYNMSLGAAQLGQTSIPIGGINTNSVIAGHRGWNGADYFRYIALITNSFHTWLGTVPKIRYSLPIIAAPMETAIWRF